MKRSELKRSTTPLRRVSKKRQKENAERSKMLAAKRKQIQQCQAQCVPQCTGRLDDGHEVLTRGRGGSITDPDNVILVCRPCHNWITEHPIEAAELGLVKHAWEKLLEDSYDSIDRFDRVPMQLDLEMRSSRNKPSVPKAIAEEAWKEYEARYGDAQTFESFHQRGGFEAVELMTFLVLRIKRLERELKSASPRV